MPGHNKTPSFGQPVPAPPEPPAPVVPYFHERVAALAQIGSLRAVPHAVLEQLAPLCTLRAFAPGTRITHERSAALLSVLLQGRLSLVLHDRLGHRVPVERVLPGDTFGEGPLFSDLFTSITADVKTTCYVLQLSLDDVRVVMKDAPALADALRMMYLRRLIESSLGRVPLFSNLPPPDRVHLTELLQERHYERGETIVRKGTQGDSLYIIEAGQVAVERNGHVLAHLDEGHFFGEMSLLTNDPHNADVVALTPVRTLALPAADFLHLLEQVPALAEELHKIVAQRRQSTATQLDDADHAHQLALSVERGLLRGTHLLLRDDALCDPQCTRCEDACASRYGRARLKLPGTPINGVHVADACRQCRFGAECVEACPEDAIRWNGSGVLLVTERCTGCGDCVPACPYGAIALMPRAPQQHAPLRSVWQAWKRLRSPTIPLHAEPPLADKCDLCSGHEDRACVSACPTGALRLVPLQEVFPL